MKANGHIDVSVNMKGRNSDVKKDEKDVQNGKLETGWRPLKMNFCTSKRSGLNPFLPDSCVSAYHVVLLSSTFSVRVPAPFHNISL